MIKNHYEQGTIKVDEIDLGFCKLCIIVVVDLCGFTQQLGEYKMIKLEARLKNMNVLGADCIIAYPNLFTIQKQEVTKLLLTNELYSDDNECRLEER